MKTKTFPTGKEVHVGSRTYFLPDSIVLIEAELNYSNIYLTNGRKVLVSICLKRLEEKLSEIKSFTRVHRHFIINKNYLKSVEPGRILLEYDMECLVSRRKMKNIS